MSVKYGYVRVSTKQQNLERQIQAIQKYDHTIPSENIFKDKISGRIFKRPQYDAMKQLILNVKDACSGTEKQPVIEIIVEELDRLGRTKSGILEELKWFADNHIRIRVLEIPTTLMDIDTRNEWVLDMINKILIEVYASLAEQEMEKRIKRQAEGIAVAKAEGKYRGRKPISVDQDRLKTVYEKWKAKELSAVQAQQELNLKPNTFYRRIKEYEAVTK